MDLYQINKGPFTHHVECIPTVEDKVMVQFLTQWNNAKIPEEMQMKHQMILSKQDLIDLGKELIKQGKA